MSSPLNFLLIEDQKFSVDLFRAAFSDHNIRVAETGEEGLKAYLEAKPDIVFLDIGLPDISGLEVLQQIRQFNPKAYVIMLSGMNNAAYVQKAKELGAAGFLSKPYQKDYIDHYIESYRAGES